MYLAYMKNTSTAKIYAKGLKHLFPDHFNWKEAGVDRSAIEPEVLAAQMQQWKAFFKMFIAIYVFLLYS